MSLAPTRLHSRSYPRRFTFYLAEPLSSVLDAIGIHMHSLKVAGGIIETHSLPTLTRA
jgi:hypothetical protein